MALARPFKTLLIANRGEIACRIVRTARRMGIATIAVYSEADANGLHVKGADRAYCIGPSPANESYLSIAKLMDAARASGAEAIHPGYGFLSEKADFAEACSDEGLIFVGPDAAAMRSMGSKAAAKSIMLAAGVPVVPGYGGDQQTEDAFADAAADIGYPVLLKAVAGGGGKGMRAVHTPKEFSAAFAGAKREAEAAFGDGRLLLEKLIEKPRHVEVQVFGDTHGSIVSLFERECTLQRRHQKVVEEAPSSTLSKARRELLYETARRAASAVNYIGAGTVEFVADASREYFIEMNTRLQVEHPVTEEITGLDLVEWQLRVAMGEPLPLRQNDITMKGHAIEARIYAEDTAAGFLPSLGTITHWSAPAENDGTRIDSGFTEGDTVTPFYDPLLAKLIVHANTRSEALTKMRAALSRFQIAGVTATVPFLSRLLAEDAVAANALDTGYIERESRAASHDGATATPAPFIVAAAVASILQFEKEALARSSRDPHSPWLTRSGWMLHGARRRPLHFQAARGGSRNAELIYQRDGLELRIDGGDVFAFTCRKLSGAHVIQVAFGAMTAPATAFFDGTAATVFDDAQPCCLTLHDPSAPADLPPEKAGLPVAAMPGTILALLAEPGQTFDAGTPMLVLEAMKMEHTLRFPARGRVERYLYNIGEFVSEGTVLAEFTPDTGPLDG